MDVKEVAKKHALKNAFEYGKAQPGGIVGKVIAEVPDAKNDMKATMKIIGDVAAEVNKMKKEQIEEEMKKFTFVEREKQREGLPELEFAKNGIVTRFAPNPNGTLTLGHARTLVPCDEYVKMYGGKLILRFEDTDPGIKKPMMEAYTWMPEDVKWLGCTISETIIQSERMAIYYKYAEKLIELGKAYVCHCSQEQVTENRNSGTTCKCRDQTPADAMKEWKKMISDFGGESPVLRLKTDMGHENTSVRDWIAFRIVEDEHTLVGKKYRAWPLYNFAAPIDDHETGVNFLIRGKEHEISAVKQKYLLDYLGWEAPHIQEIGLLTIPGIMAHKSDIVRGIKDGTYTGWDDVRLPIIRALKRRGIQAEAIRKYMISLGINKSDSVLDWTKFYKINAEILQPISPHLFFVEKPVKISVSGVAPTVLEIEKFPKEPEKGMRKLSFNGNVFVAGADFEMNTEKVVRLKDLANVTMKEKTAFVGNEIAREMPKIQWVPSEEAVSVRVLKPDGSVCEGVGEKEVSLLKIGDIVQFERFGYCRYDHEEKGVRVFYFAH